MNPNRFFNKMNWSIITVVLLGIYSTIYWKSINLDVGMYVESAHMILEGKKVFVDIVDTNLPLNMYIHVLPEFFAQLLNINSVITFNIFVCCLILLSIALMSILAERLGLPNKYWYACCLPILIVSITSFVRINFGQRELLFVILYAPFLLLQILRLENIPVSKSISMIIGILGCIGIMIKPHFVVIAVVVQMAIFVSDIKIFKKAYIEYLGIALAAGLYLFFFLGISKEIRESFLDIWLPLLAKNYYSSRLSIGTLLYSSPILLYSAIVIIGLVFRAKQLGVSNKISKLYIVLISAAGGAIAIFIIQAKGWPYHTIPIQYFITVALVVYFVDKKLNIDSLKKLNVDGIFIVGGMFLFAVHDAIYLYTHGKIWQTISAVLFEPPLLLLTISIFIVIIEKKMFASRKTAFVIILSLIIMFAIIANPVRIIQKESDLNKYIQKYTDKNEKVIVVGRPFPALSQTQRHSGTRYLATLGVFSLAIAGKNRTMEKLLCSKDVHWFLDSLGLDIKRNKPTAVVFENELTIGDKPVYDFFNIAGFNDKYLNGYRMIHENEFVVYVKQPSI